MSDKDKKESMKKRSCPSYLCDVLSLTDEQLKAHFQCRCNKLCNKCHDHITVRLSTHTLPHTFKHV
eukprot:COSAG03_NODE_2512_length_2685_cov_6.684841_1_plen_66_part_00